MRIVKVALVKECINKTKGRKQRAVADYMSGKVKMMSCRKYPQVVQLPGNARKSN
jgi:hypothetical protein